MRKASQILGVIGSCLTLIYGIIIVMLLSGAFMSPLYSPSFDFSDVTNSMFSVGSVLYIVICIIAISAVVPAILGCVLFNRNRKTAGVLFTVAGGLSLFNFFIAGVLLVLAGIFTLIDKRTQPPMAASPPYPPYPPYGAQAVPPPSNSTENKEN